MFSSISPMSVRALAHVGRRLLSTSAAAPAGLRARLQNDLKTAMKNRSDKDRLSAVRSAISAVTYADKNAGAPVDDDKIVAELRRIVRKHEESIDQFVAAGHNDAAQLEKVQMAVVCEYIPQSMTAEEIEAAVQAAIASTGAASIKDMGKVMDVIKATLSETKAPRKLVSEAIKKLLPPPAAK